MSCFYILLFTRNSFIGEGRSKLHNWERPRYVVRPVDPRRNNSKPGPFLQHARGASKAQVGALLAGVRGGAGG